MKTNPNHPSSPIVGQEGFPTNEDALDPVTPEKDLIGLTKREYFAAMAMQSFSYDKTARACDEPTELFYTKVAEASVRMADALINELNKPA